MMHKNPTRRGDFVAVRVNKRKRIWRVGLVHRCHEGLATVIRFADGTTEEIGDRARLIARADSFIDGAERFVRDLAELDDRFTYDRLRELAEGSRKE